MLIAYNEVCHLMSTDFYIINNPIIERAKSLHDHQMLEDMEILIFKYCISS